MRCYDNQESRLLEPGELNDGVLGHVACAFDGLVLNGNACGKCLHQLL